MDIAILATFRHPSGEDSAFYLAKSPFGSRVLSEENLVQFTFYFHPMTRWLKMFDAALARLHNSGVWNEEFKRAK